MPKNEISLNIFLLRVRYLQGDNSVNIKHYTSRSGWGWNKGSGRSDNS